MGAKEILQFLKKLSKENNREWFLANKEEYLQTKSDFEELIKHQIDLLSSDDRSYEGLDAKDCIFRIYRDVRFSKDKKPYKNNFGAFIAPGGRKASMPGYYFHIEPGKSFAGGGVYRPGPKILKVLRQEIDYNLDKFKEVINESSFRKNFKELQGRKLKRAPKGYDEKNPAIEYLKYQDFIVSKPLSDKELCDPDLDKNLFHIFNSMKSFNEFLKIPIFEVVSEEEEPD